MTRAKKPSVAAARQRVAELSAEIVRHDRLYHVEAKPVISDYEYDQLVKVWNFTGYEVRYLARAVRYGWATLEEHNLRIRIRSLGFRSSGRTRRHASDHRDLLTHNRPFWADEYTMRQRQSPLAHTP